VLPPAIKWEFRGEIGMEKGIGDMIKDIRKKKGMNLSELEKLTGMGISKLSRIENNHQTPTIEELNIIATSLGVSYKDLIEGDKPLIRQAQSGDLVEKIKRAGKLYALKDEEEFTGSEVGRIITKEIPMSLIAEANINQDKFLVAGSIGKGQFAEIPWIAIFNRKITESATKGIYIVYLYTADMKGIYLSLNQGYTYFRDKFGSKQAKVEIEKMAATLRELIFIPENMKTFSIDLKATKSLGKGYMAGHIAGKYYDLENMPGDDTLILDLLELINVYDEINLLIGNRTPEQFYDYLVAKKEGWVDSEHEVDSTMQTQEEKSEDNNFDDEEGPIDRQDPVVDRGGNIRFLRNPKVAIQALKKAQYKCEINDAHETFIAKSSNKPYVESHHLIPISNSAMFGFSIDITANICSLCPNCHRAIHSATDEVKREMLTKLYEKRKERLEKSGIYITLEKLLNFYGIE